MGDVVQLKVRPRCTNTTRCTFDDCPLKAAEQRLGPGYYLGNCSRYLWTHTAELMRTFAEVKGAEQQEKDGG